MGEQDRCAKCEIKSCDNCTGCEHLECNNFFDCKCPKCEWANNVMKLSEKELKVKIDDFKYSLNFLKELSYKKAIEQFNWSGKYIKVYGCNGDGPEYINCETCSLDKSSQHINLQIHFKGIGFHYEFGPYADSNYVYFSTWDDHYLNYDYWERAEKLRNSGKIKQSDYNWNNYRVEVIDKEEYEKAFNEMISKFIDTFNKWK